MKSKWFCKHTYKTVACNTVSGKPSVKKCSKCGKVISLVELKEVWKEGIHPYKA